MAQPLDPSARSSGLRSVRTPRRRLVLDRVARWVVSAGGLAIIVAILGILVFILVEVWPLLARPRVDVARRLDVPGAQLGAVLADEHRSTVAGLTPGGRVVVVNVKDGKVLQSVDVLGALTPGPSPSSPHPVPGRGEKSKATSPDASSASSCLPSPGGGEGGAGRGAGGEGLCPRPALSSLQVQPQSDILSAATSDGRVLLLPVRFATTFSELGARGTDTTVGPPVFLAADPQGRPVRHYAAQLDEDGNATAAAELADGTLAIVRRASEKNEITGETAESVTRQEAPLPGPLTVLFLDKAQRNLYAGTPDGELLWWPLQDGAPGAVSTASAGTSPITAVSALIGDRALLVGQQDGSLSIWLQVRQSDDSFRLTRVRDFPRHSGAITALAPSPRDKCFLAADAGNRLGLYHSTSHRILWEGASPLAGSTSLFYAPKADGALVAAGSKIASLDVFNPHPEVSWRTLFGKVWYEGYDHPEYVWQSSGASDDVEPKLSLTPLLAGTLKGTIYSLLLAIPLGVYGAMYASQFMHPAYKRTLKPLIEIMASLPSVVLGFLAGLWLAPRLEKAVPALALMVIVLPLVVLLTGFAWRLLPRAFRGRFPMGTEVLLFVVVLALGIWLCLGLSKPFESLAFGGNFQSWLLATTGLPFDQRNAVVVGLAMGFAVIPIIFAIAEDAFSNVPGNLVAGSLALGADRWQTVTRVVLPTASPGIFSAIMIGFGRAIGETMIVLMATGNTPIIDWNPFNGFRTLSANIAVEIPEAPHGGTLYRMLFLAALLLFILTFLINTVAELVRQRLRERFSQL
jgi:phosphate transport system permease protein